MTVSLPLDHRLVGDSRPRGTVVHVAGTDEDGCAVALSSCWEATVDRDFLHHNFLCETTLLPFRVPAFRLSWLPELE